MQEVVEPLRHYLVRLGLDERSADIYQALKQYGPQTMSEVARTSGVSRTRIYRVLDSLINAGLVEVQTHHKRSILEAASFSKIQVALAKKEQEVSELQKEYQQLVGKIDLHMVQSGRSRVYFYEGLEGIKQMLWTQTKYSGENLSILRDGMKQQVGLAFFERWSQECNDKNIQFRSIIDNNFITTQEEWYALHTNKKLEHWRARWVPEDVLPINYSMVIFGDIVMHYNWDHQQKFGIAIHDKFIAGMQRNMFEILWKMGKPYTED